MGICEQAAVAMAAAVCRKHIANETKAFRDNFF